MTGTPSTTPEPTPTPAPSLISSDPPQTPAPEPTPGTPTPDPAPKATSDPAPAPDPAPEPEPFTFSDLTLPDGFEMAEEQQTQFLEVINDGDLSAKDRAQKMLDMHTAMMTEAAQKMRDGWDSTVSEWVDEVKADPNIGGEKLEPALGEIAKLLSTYEKGDEVRKAFDLTSAGSHPAVVRFMHWVATQLNEGKPASGAPAAGQTSAAQKLFPNSK